MEEIFHLGASQDGLGRVERGCLRPNMHPNASCSGRFAMKKRRMMFIPEVNSKSFVLFFERGNSGTSWSIRDYSIRNCVRERGPHDFQRTADEIHEEAQFSFDAPTVSTTDLSFWHQQTD